ncbi:MAG: creatininase family protein [Clostridia bacterium]|nr:creatininase family protein [Clostridia bacterium]
MKAKSLSVFFLLFCMVLITSCTSKAQEKPPDKSIFKDTMVEMTWEEVKKEAEKGSVVLFPIAVVEEHGPHMDLSPDIYETYHGCKLMKQSLEKKGISTVIAPPYYWGINQSTGQFPGSFTVKPETFKAVLSDSIECLKRWGFTKVFCSNLHGDPVHRATLDSAINEIRTNLGIDVYNVDALNVKVQNPPAFPSSWPGKYNPDYHAGADETSMMLSCYPDKVNTELAKKLKPQSAFEPLGYVGDPANFSKGKGGEILNVLSERGALAIEAFLKQQKK